MPWTTFIVDDEQVIADTLSAILKHHGYSARAFYDAKSALDACLMATPDLVITDVMMPGMNGVDMAIRIKALCPSCRILLFSGQSSTAAVLEKAERDGHVFDLLLKPVHPTDLLAKLDTIAHVAQESIAESKIA